MTLTEILKIYDIFVVDNKYVFRKKGETIFEGNRIKQNNDRESDAGYCSMVQRELDDSKPRFL